MKEHAGQPERAAGRQPDTGATRRPVAGAFRRGARHGGPPARAPRAPAAAAHDPGRRGLHGLVRRLQHPPLLEDHPRGVRCARLPARLLPAQRGARGRRRAGTPPAPPAALVLGRTQRRAHAGPAGRRAPADGDAGPAVRQPGRAGRLHLGPERFGKEHLPAHGGPEPGGGARLRLLLRAAGAPAGRAGARQHAERGFAAGRRESLYVGTAPRARTAGCERGAGGHLPGRRGLPRHQPPGIGVGRSRGAGKPVRARPGAGVLAQPGAGTYPRGQAGTVPHRYRQWPAGPVAGRAAQPERHCAAGHAGFRGADRRSCRRGGALAQRTPDRVRGKAAARLSCA